LNYYLRYKGDMRLLKLKYNLRTKELKCKIDHTDLTQLGYSPQHDLAKYMG